MRFKKEKEEGGARSEKLHQVMFSAPSEDRGDSSFFLLPEPSPSVEEEEMEFNQAVGWQGRGC